MMNRRDFVRAATVATAATVSLPRAGLKAAESKSVRWPIGCFNRPWSNWPHDVGFDGIKAAGYKLIGLLSRSKNEPFIGADATPEYLDNLKKKLRLRGL